MVAIVLLCLKLNSAPENNAPAVIGGGEPIPEDVNKEKDLTSTHLPAYGSLSFAAGKKEQTVLLQNPGENAVNAKRAWLEAAIEDGIEIREPSGQTSYSGQFKLRLPKTLHRLLAEQARKEGISMNQYCIYLLSKNSA